MGKRGVVDLLLLPLSLTSRGESSRKKMMMMVMRIRWIGWRIWVKLNERLIEIMLEERKMREKEERERDKVEIREKGARFFFYLRPAGAGCRDLAA